MPNATIKLSQPYVVHQQTFNTLELREPTGADYWHVGPIQEWQRAGDGVALITYHDKIADYARRLAQPPQGLATEAMLAALNLSDAMKVSRAVEDFFTEAERSSRPQTS